MSITYISLCVLCGCVAQPGHLCREKFEKQIGMKDGVAHFPALEIGAVCDCGHDKECTICRGTGRVVGY